MTRKIGLPSKVSPTYIAGRALHANGSCTRAQLLLLANFGATELLQAARLRRAMDNGWLVEHPDGLIGLSLRLREHFAEVEPTPVMVGMTATPRVNVNAGLPLSAKYHLNTKGLRPGAMDNSREAMPSVYAKVTP